MESVAELIQRLRDNVRRVLVGQEQALELVLLGLLAEGHLLIEGVPGVGKTVLARSLALSLGCTFRRIQFTPDMLPSDITGVYVFNPQTREFEFRPGPVLAQVVLADEINRATPKTQAALLEAMSEGQVTVDGVSHPLPRPFVVLATLNPVESEGTFPLPEGELDRFLLRVGLSYTSLEEEMEVLERQRERHPLETLGPVASAEDLRQAQRQVRRVFVAPAVQEYIVRLNRHLRQHPDVLLGPSPRASLGVYRTAQARAAAQGRGFVLPDDVQALAPAVLAHRLLLAPSARLRSARADELLRETLRDVPVPTGDLRPTP